MNAQATILAVDDTTDSLVLLRELLTPAGYRVRLADSGELALAAALALPPDLILLDLKMPGIDGLEVCRRLKAQESTRDIPVILLSAYAGVEEWVKGLRLGAVDHIGKPFQADELLVRVRTHLALRQARESAAESAALRELNQKLESEIVQRQQAEADLRNEIAERRRSEQLLRQSQDQLALAQSSAGAGLWVVDLASGRIDWSPQLFELFGLDPKTAQSDVPTWTQLVHPEDRSAALRRFEDAVRNRAQLDSEYRVVLPTGEVRWIQTLGRITQDAAGQAPHLSGICLDITDRKLAERKLRETLAEKEVLLKEVHHRVKNNLQVVSGLLDLQAARLADPAVRRVLLESQNRIRSIALVHEKLYQSEGLAQIDFKAYVQSLLSHLLHAQLGQPAGARFDVRMEAVSLSLAAAVPCGLLINELITNALKHAWPETEPARTKECVLAWEETGPNWRLSVADNGVGLPADFNLAQASTLGLRLVQLLSRQLKGTVRLEPGPGARFIIEFPKP